MPSFRVVLVPYSKVGYPAFKSKPSAEFCKSSLNRCSATVLVTRLRNCVGWTYPDVRTLLAAQQLVAQCGGSWSTISSRTVNVCEPRHSVRRTFRLIAGFTRPCCGSTQWVYRQSLFGHAALTRASLSHMLEDIGPRSRMQILMRFQPQTRRRRFTRLEPLLTTTMECNA